MKKVGIVLGVLLLAGAVGCGKKAQVLPEDNTQAGEVMSAEINGTAITEPEMAQTQKEELLLQNEIEENLPKESIAGQPASSFELGSAKELKGKNLLVSVFVSTDEMGWNENRMHNCKNKIEAAADYITEQAALYGQETELVYDWEQMPDLCYQEHIDFEVSGAGDEFYDTLDEEIAKWLTEDISYDELMKKYAADGIVALLFFEEKGVSYAIVYDGEDNPQESIVLFTKDYYKDGYEETATSYAHEILHAFGAHDLYPEAEYDEAVTSYIEENALGGIMFSVTETTEDSLNNRITHPVSDITAYHLGWLDTIKEIEQFPALTR